MEVRRRKTRLAARRGRISACFDLSLDMSHNVLLSPTYILRRDCDLSRGQRLYICTYLLYICTATLLYRKRSASIGERFNIVHTASVTFYKRLTRHRLAPPVTTPFFDIDFIARSRSRTTPCIVWSPSTYRTSNGASGRGVVSVCVSHGATTRLGVKCAQ